ncbi:MAG TPA: transposase [Blastocatellia bacterium]|nr:transposase [Blastocatellia bacterium]
MAQTLVSLLLHVIFSTKNREGLITPEIEPSLYAYLGGISKNHESKLLASGGTSNYVHLLISQSKNMALSDLVEEPKKSSSVWIKTQGREFASFHWQDGYAAFSIEESQVPAVKAYLAKQKEHHARKTFQEELIEFLEKYGVEYNENYLWS